MKIILDPKKSVQENAAAYFERAKKLRAKAEGARAAVLRFKEKLKLLEKEEASRKEKEAAGAETKTKLFAPKKATQWYEKYRWFVSSEGFLCVGGRDASTNESLVKKHTSSDDIVFHTDMAGSPFFVVKTEGKPAGDATLHEVACATASFSRAWKNHLLATDVFWVKPEQLSKTPEAGEFLGKGAFVVRGKTNYVPNKVGLAVGVLDDGSMAGRVVCGPEDAVKKHCKAHVNIVPGNDKASDVAKKLQKLLKTGASLDEIIRVLPSGGIKIVQSS